MSKWNKEELRTLYEKYTLEEIGLQKGVTRERVRQVMERFGIPRNTLSTRRPSKTYKPRYIYTNLHAFLSQGKKHNGQRETTKVLRRFISTTRCSECGKQSKKINIHHINYPALAREDLQVLCYSCHQIKHRTGINYEQQLLIYEYYKQGVSTIRLAQRFQTCRTTIYTILHKIKDTKSKLRFEKNQPRLLRQKN